MADPLVGDQLQVAAGANLDYETAHSYQVQVRAMDLDCPVVFHDQVWTIEVTNVHS